MFFHTQYIHLFRPFLKYTPSASPLPSHVSPRRICTANAGAISKLMRLYKKAWNLRQIPNIAVYMLHSACIIHLLNLPEKTAKRDIIHGVKHLEEIAEDWLCARRTLSILSVLARKWSVDMPEDASIVLQRTDEKYGTFSTSDVPSPRSNTAASSTPEYAPPATPPLANLPHPKPEQHSPLGPFNQPRISPDPPRSAPDMLMTGSSLGAMNGTRMPSHHVPASDTSMATSTDSLSAGSWGPVGVAPSLSNYQQQYSLSRGNLGSAATSQAATRQVSPSSVFQEQSVDGQNWFLNDGVRWQQNFHAWELSNAAATSGGASAALNSLANDPVFMFRGGNTPRPSSDDNLAGFDAFNASFNSSGWLQGLD
jgi:hypothetical protein